MALTESNMLPLGTQAPDFQLLDTVSGKMLSLKDIQSDKATVIIFSCNHCPFVIHLNSAIVQFANDYQKKGVAFCIISSNDVENYPADSPDKMKILAKEEGYSFPYLYDETQAVAKAYDAACTPDFYIFDGAGKLAYRGRFDGARPGNDIPVTGEDIRKALDEVLDKKAVSFEQRASAGCNIKWIK